jgi:F5/8 type C domain/Pectate lyase superfamily protein
LKGVADAVTARASRRHDFEVVCSLGLPALLVAGLTGTAAAAVIHPAAAPRDAATPRLSTPTTGTHERARPMFAIRARIHRPPRPLATLAAAVLTVPLLAVVVAGPAAAATAPGAPVPFTEYNAATSAAAQTNGTVLATDYQYGSLQAEATGRQAVELIGQGQYVSFTLTAAANAVDFHYAIPDSADGSGLTAPLDLYVNGTLTTALSLTSKYSWLYGQYPFSNTPSVGVPDGAVPHDFYNDVRYLFSSTLPAGTVVKLQVDSADTAPWYAVNTADFETVAAPVAQPSGSINVTQAPYNADSTGAADATSALQNAITAASAAGEGVYIPKGTYTVSQPINVNNVTIEGAGEWYTSLTGSDVEFSGLQNPASTNVKVSNLSLLGEVNNRDNSTSDYTAFNGGFSNSTISDIWIQNEKSGIYIIGPTNNVTINAVRILDTTADGINLYAADGPITNSTVENTFERNTQDDGIALWSATAGDTSDTVTQNTVDSPGLANNIGIYGSGSGDQITGNLLQDTVQRGGAIEISQNYGAIPMAGTLTISGNELVRAGQFDSGYDYGVGAIWIFPAQGNMNSTISITGNTILNSPYEAFMFQNQNVYSGAAVTTPPTSGYDVTGVSITNNTVTNVGTFVFQDQAPGSATVSGTTATGVGDAGIFSCGSGFTLTQGSGNSGLGTTTCGMPSSSPLWGYPGTTTFQNATTGQATASQQVVIFNTASAAASLAAVTASSGFTVSRDPTYPCGTSLDATGVSDNGAWCMVDVSFDPSAAGTTTGKLSIPSGEPGSPATAQLIGTATGSGGGGGGGGSSGNLAMGATMTASSTQPGYPASNTNDGNQGTYWESQDGAAYPQTLTADLGSAQKLGSAVLTLPSGWPARTQTLSVLGSASGSSYSTLVSSATYTFDPSTGNTVTIPLPAGTSDRYLRLSVTANSGWSAAQLAEFGIFSGTNLAAGKPVTASSTQSGYPASNATDGNTGTYWESSGGTWPATLTADLGATHALTSVVIDVPPSWPTRTQTLSVLGSTNDSTWTTLAASAADTWNPSTGDAVTITLPAGTSERYVRLSFTANNVQNAAQVAEFGVLG